MKLLKADDVAQVLQIPKARVYELIRQGGLPAVHIGRQVRVSEDELRTWIVQGGVSLHADEEAGVSAEQNSSGIFPTRR